MVSLERAIKLVRLLVTGSKEDLYCQIANRKKVDREWSTWGFSGKTKING